MGEPWCLWGAEQGRIRHPACRGVGGPLPAVGVSHGVGWGWSGWAGGRKGEAEASAQGPEAPACRANSATGSGANVERGGGRVRCGWWSSLGVGGGGLGGVGGPELGSGVGGVWWWWVRPATGVLLRGSDEGEDCLGTEAGEPGAGEWGAGGGLSPAGMAGVPWGPVGAEAPHVGWVRNLGLFFRHRSS